jgi:hypothetical protein
MHKKRVSVPLNHCVLSALQAGVKVSCEPTRVDTRRLLVHLVCRHVGGSNAGSSPDNVPPPPWRHWPTNQSVVNGKTKDHGDILKHHRGIAAHKVERVGLQTSLVHLCCQCHGVHQW